ncbi:MAG: hypothetical protein M3Y72_08230 [Acidobacteriota bacterium]|nr:hypothetical protein [Acidobacteriota bacterium]
MLRLRPAEQDEIRTPQDEDATFILRYVDLLVGDLGLHEGVWTFEYTDAFRQQADVKPLIDFPDVTKTYVSPTLWPFFLARIPGISQPKVRDEISKAGLDEHSDVQLLRRFGQQTISNPFILMAS